MTSEFQQNELLALKAENTRLIELLEVHGIDWRLSFNSAEPVSGPDASIPSIADKLALFRRLFRGRTDTYPARWESKTTGPFRLCPRLRQ